MLLCMTIGKCREFADCCQRQSHSRELADCSGLVLFCLTKLQLRGTMKRCGHPLLLTRVQACTSGLLKLARPIYQSC